MRQRLAIIIFVALVLVVLVAINAASYVRVEKTPDTEFNPDRSTYNSGATGTRALYDFLSESGRDVVRWSEAPAALLNRGRTQPATFVVIGETRVPFEETEAATLLQWVENGGRLVIIDRMPYTRLLPLSGNWRVSTELLQYPTSDVHSDNPEEMTAGVSLARAAQPTRLTRDVESIMPSRFASLIRLYPERKEKPATNEQADEAPDEEAGGDTDVPEETTGEQPPPPPAEAPASAPPPAARPLSPAPVVHLVDHRGALLVDYPHGAGRIILLSDPFIVANGGISRADNLQLATNVIAGIEGLIAFDEYHQGRTAARNHLLAYFAGTPVLAMIAQFGLIILVVLWTGGRRFARPLPVPHLDRRSSLEFVASMAELQQRARAFDLALENIYTRTRRVLVRYAGVENNSSRAVIAARVAARSGLSQQKLESLMRDCEDAINGAPINARRTLLLVQQLRELERTLGLRMRSREIRQARER